MTTLEKIVSELPHGFHDAYIHTCALDFVACTASFDIDVWVGDENAEGEASEAYRSGRLVIHGLLFCELQPPSVDYLFAEAKPLWIDRFEADKLHPLVELLPAGAFAERFFVSNWNSFIQFAGTHAELLWSS